MKSRKGQWLRGEEILVLDLYLKEGSTPAAEKADLVSEQLRSIPIERELADDPSFRNRAAVLMKVLNFVALNPDRDRKGYDNFSRLDERIWNELGRDPKRVAEIANALRISIDQLAPEG